LLMVSVMDPNQFKFVPTAEGVTPNLDPSSLVSEIDIPQQVDMEVTLNTAAAAIGDTLENTVNSLLIGSFVFNFFVSVSMKQLL